MRKQYVYIVHDEHLGGHRCKTLGELSAYLAYCFDNGHSVRGITRAKREPSTNPTKGIARK